MRFVAVKTEEQQAQAMLFRTRDLLVRQRTQLVNALRGHLAEHGVVAPQGLVNVKRLAAAIDGSTDDSLPSLVRELGQRYLDLITRLDGEIAELEKRLRRLTRDNEASAGCRPCLGSVRHRCGDRGFCPTDGDIQTGARFCRLARPGPPATLNRRQGKAGADIEDGAA